MRTSWLIAAVLVLALTAGLASAAPAKDGGVLVVGNTGASVQIDPQLSYVSTGWWLEYATAAKLYNYRDEAGAAGGLLRPEVASGFTISDGGKTYAFTIRNGFRFSDGSPVTAKNFAYAFRRADALQSPARAYMGSVKSVRANAKRLVIRLSKPDSSLLTKLAMPFFQATSLKLPLASEVTTGYPSAGPYYFARNEVNVLTSLGLNPYWHRNRPHHLAGVDVRWNQPENAEPLDMTTPPVSEVPQLVQRFGINKTRLWIKPTSCVGYVGFNNQKGLFAGNPALRKAVSWAVDRMAYVQAAGPFAGKPWTHLLSPITPGSITAQSKQPYGSRPDLKKARSLAAGHFRDGKLAIGYQQTHAGPAQAQVVRQNMIALGFDQANIQMNPMPRSDVYGPQPVPSWDLWVGIGYCGDVDGLTDLKTLLTYWHPGADVAKFARLAKLSGKARSRAAGRLDLDVMKSSAPVAAMRTYDQTFFFSNRVDPRSLVYQPVYTDWSIPALRLK